MRRLTLSSSRSTRSSSCPILTIRPVAETTRHSFVGTPEHVASEIDRYVQGRASDGFVLVPHLTPTGLDEFLKSASLYKGIQLPDGTFAFQVFPYPGRNAS